MRGLPDLYSLRTLFGGATSPTPEAMPAGSIMAERVTPQGGRQIRIRSAAEVRAEASSGTEVRRLLPIRHATREQATFRAYFDKGCTLARQDHWDLLSKMIRETDRLRETAPAGVRMSDVLAAGARSDMVGAARKAILRGARPCEASLADLDEMASDGDWPLAATIARLHIDLAWLNHGDLPPVARPARPSISFERHMARAAQLLDGYSPIEEDSPMLAETRIGLLAGHVDARARMRDDFEDLIDLDPANPGPLRAFGLYLTPDWYGTDATAIDMAARATADRLTDIWGDGAYAWIWLDALSTDPESAAACDATRLRRGLFDILDRSATQEVANLLAGFCALAMAPGRAPVGLSQAARSARTVLHGAADAIIEHHMTEIRPALWLRGARPALALAEEPMSPADLAADAAQIAAIVKARRSGAISH